MAAKAHPYHHGALRESLVEAGIALLHDGGVEALTLRAAARKAGVSQAAPYRHFAHRAELVAAVAARGFVKLREAMIAAAGDAPHSREALRAVARAYVNFGVRHPAEYRLMFGYETAGSGRFSEIEETSLSVLDLLRYAIGALQEGGLIRKMDVNDVALTAWSTMHGLVHLILDGRVPLGKKKTTTPHSEKELEPYVLAATDLLMFGMAAGKAPRRSAAKSARRSLR